MPAKPSEPKAVEFVSGAERRVNKVHDFIVRILATSGKLPTYSMIRDEFEAESQASIHNFLHALERRGLIDLEVSSHGVAVTRA